MRDGVVAILLRGSQILVIERGATVPFPGYWAPLSGKVDPGESIEAALSREIEEEVGFIAKPIRCLWQSVSQAGDFRLHWWAAEVIGGALKPDPREVSRTRWIHPQQHSALTPVFDSDRHFFGKILPALNDPALKPRRARAVLFDFDYTLADSSAGAIECANFALRKLGISEAPPEKIRRTIGLSLNETYVQLAGNADPGATAAFGSAFVERADQVMAELTKMYTEVGPTLNRLRDRGLQLGIVSTKFRYRIEHILEMHGLASAFSVIVGGQDVERLKPEPDALVLACDRLGVTRSEALYVGDHVVDAIAAAAAGISIAVVLTGTCVAGDFAAHAPAAIIGSLSQLVVS